jgi:uncharacterized protein Usg
MKNIELLLRDYRLTTAEILYHFPDFPSLLQTYVWQEYDQSPDFPVLMKFLNFWERSLEGRLHSVKVTNVELIKPSELRIGKGEFYLQ